jgi:hypothetical protein
MRTIEQMVQQEVEVCLSALVSTLADTTSYELQKKTAPNAEANAAHYDLCIGAQELAAPIDDWEEAAMQDGWRDIGDCRWTQTPAGKDDGEYIVADNAERLCDQLGIEPYSREVFEFWAVSAWLAEKLAAHGEKVDTDFAGMNVWARTTTGQGIASDGVIGRIHADMIAA